jgi:hypothetical protein
MYAPPYLGEHYCKDDARTSYGSVSVQQNGGVPTANIRKVVKELCRAASPVVYAALVE